MALGTGCRGVDEEGLCLVGVVEDLALEVESAEVGVDDASAVVGPAEGDLVVAPEGGELLALRQERLAGLAHPGVGALPGVERGPRSRTTASRPSAVTASTTTAASSLFDR